MAEQLTDAQCILLAVDYATQSNIQALHDLVPITPLCLTPNLVLRILLTYLPESVPPPVYTTFIQELVSHLWLEQREPQTLDISSVADITDAAAQKRVKKLDLLELAPAGFPPHAPDDDLTSFLCHRSYRIDSEIGLLTLLPELFRPFLDRNDFVRAWFVSVALPLLRLQFEYYPDTDTAMSLKDFQDLDGKDGIDVLLSRTTHEKHKIISATDSQGTIARDLRGLVGPWMFGHTERKRRKLAWSQEERSETPQEERKISLAGVTEDDQTTHEWEYVFEWMVKKATNNFAMVTNAVEEWDGPGHVDLGGYLDEKSYLDNDLRMKLDKQYAQCAFAACYAVEANNSETIDGAHGILVRLAQLLDFEPPPDLVTSVEELPKIDRHASLLHESKSTVILDPEVLLDPNHPLTSPTLPTFMLLQMMVYSAYQLAGLGHSISISHITKFRFYSDEDEQMSMVQKVLHGLSQGGKRDEHQWMTDRGRLLWLWNWNIDPEEGALRGAGPFGSIPRDALEKAILKCMLSTGNHSLVENIYLKGDTNRSRLTREDLEQIIVGEAMESYDNASNGNKTRGSMKRASDIINNFRSNFKGSKAFERASALISATHSLSFYSLTLQHGVPFQPVNIRVSQDPLALLAKVLVQNPRSYTKLDDLIGIGRNLAMAGLATSEADGDAHLDQTSLEQDQAVKVAERRVIFMCIEAALTEDDFDTAYSYLINRLAPEPPTVPPPTSENGPTPSNQSPTTPTEQDDISWRAAFLAGRYRPRQTNTTPSLPSQIRRLEQRTELLSLSLLLAPPSALSEILTVYRRSEEEMSALLIQQSEAESAHDDRSQRVAPSTSALPGVFTDPRTEGMVLNQQSRTSTGRVRDEEAPVGLFDLAQGAAAAFSRNAFPLRATTGARAAPPAAEGDALESEMSGDHARVRKRDMVANAATGALASGLGWVLGAPPAQHAQGQGQGQGQHRG